VKESDSFPLKGEKCKSGLFSILTLQCHGCKKEFNLATSEKNSLGHYDINLRAVWGTMTSGGGAADLNEQLQTMNIPQMHQSMFTSLEDDIGKWWNGILKEEMAKAGAEEKRIAVEEGNFCEGVPSISVVCDGGWSKRTHKHSYNALGGVGVIFGQKTKKLLYIGIRNKTCSMCERMPKNNETPKQHECYKNWTASSQAMESDIILAGFLEAESTHGVRYTKLISDGDSSVFSKLQEHVPWGRFISKLECANHACKCLRSSLEKLVEEKPQHKGKGKLTKVNRIRLTTAVRCAIKMRTKDKNHKQLKKDIKNSIWHILGFHEQCSEFCKNRKNAEKPSAIDTSNTNENEDSNDDLFDDIFEKQYEFWKMPSDEEMANVRNATANELKKGELKEVVRDVQVLLDRLASKSERLVGNFTTNLCESWMSIRSKFDGGKFVNRCGRGSWHARCYGSALRKNLGPSWSPYTYSKVTGLPAGTHFVKGSSPITEPFQSQFTQQIKTRLHQKEKQKETRKSQSVIKQKGQIRIWE